MSQITVSNLTFAYDGTYDNVFENASFTIDTDWRLGLIGRNGRGKTTLMQLLMGKYEYSGVISSSVDFDYFPYPVEDKSRDTMEIVYSVCSDCDDWQIYKEMDAMGIPLDLLFRPFSTLSNGEQTKVLLAALFLKSNNFLLIDEPTNHLDMASRGVLRDYLKKKKGFILISHDRALLDALVDHILSINKANIEVQQGNYSTWQQNREMQDNFEAEKNERLQKEIGRLTAASKKTAQWSANVEKSKFHSDNSGISTDRGFVGSRAAKMAKRSKAVQQRKQKAIDETASLMKNIEKTDRLRMRLMVMPQKRILEVRELDIAYGDNVICRQLGFELMQGQRIAITGSNGCGKSSIIKLLAGLDIPYAGNISKASGLTVSYLPQDTSFLHGSILEYAEEAGVDSGLLRGILSKLDLPRLQFEKDISNFSEGQKKKVLLARSLCDGAALYLWDEPLNFVDILSRKQIEDMILEYQPSMIFVEHDEMFVNSVATKVIRLEDYK